MSGAKIEQRNKIIRGTSLFYIQNASFSVEYMETDNVNGKGDKTREHPYVFLFCFVAQSISKYLQDHWIGNEHVYLASNLATVFNANLPLKQMMWCY